MPVTAQHRQVAHSKAHEHRQVQCLPVPCCDRHRRQEQVTATDAKSRQVTVTDAHHRLGADRACILCRMHQASALWALMLLPSGHPLHSRSPPQQLHSLTPSTVALSLTPSQSIRPRPEGDRGEGGKEAEGAYFMCAGEVVVCAVGKEVYPRGPPGPDGAPPPSIIL